MHEVQLSIQPIPFLPSPRSLSPNPQTPEGPELACSPTPEPRAVEGLEFLNEDAPLEQLPGLKAKAGTWSFEELIDLGVHAKTHALMDGDGRGPGLLEHNGVPEGPRVAFEETGNGVSGPPIQALSGEQWTPTPEHWVSLFHSTVWNYLPSS